MKNIANLLKNKNLYQTSRYLFTSGGKINKFKLTNELPKEEENLEILLRDMNIDSNRSGVLNSMMNQKDDIVHISKDAIGSAKLGQYMIFNNKHIAQCVSIKDNLVTLMLLNRVK
jgi:hypothetical protein